MKLSPFGLILPLIALLVPVALAQDYPARPVTLIVPYAAGGPADALSRLLADGLGKYLGQRVIIENVTGAGGTLGVARGAAAAPDGYTITLASNGTHGAAPALYPDLRYNPVDSFEMIGMVSTNPIAIVARKDFPANSLREFMAYSQNNKVSNATGGVGSVSQIACLHLKALGKFSTTEVPYRGTGPAIQDLLASRVDFVCDQVANVRTYVSSNMLKAFATASKNRSAGLPDVPTTTEAGLPAYQVTVWFALMFPKGTPAAIVSRLNDALGRAIDDPGFEQRIVEQGGMVATAAERGPAYLKKFVQSEVELWVPLLNAAAAAPEK